MSQYQAAPHMPWEGLEWERVGGPAPQPVCATTHTTPAPTGDGRGGGSVSSQLRVGGGSAISQPWECSQRTPQSQPPGFAHLLMAPRAAVCRAQGKAWSHPSRCHTPLGTNPGGRACAQGCTEAGSIPWKSRACGLALDTSGSSCAEGTEHMASQHDHVPVPID